MSNNAFDSSLEEEIIGSMIFDPECISDVVDIIKPSHFYHQQYQKLCEKIFNLWQEDQTLVNIIHMAHFLTEIGIGIDKITKIVNSVASTVTIRHHSQRLKTLWSLREAMKVGHTLTQSGNLKGTDEIKEVIGQSEAALSKITDTTTTTDTMATMMDALMDFGDKFEELYHKGEGVVGVASGFKSLDLKTTGFKSGDLIVVGGRPSMGKTAFALQLARNVSIEQDQTVLFFSLEMNKESLVRRMVAAEASINIQKMNSGLLQPDEYMRYTEAMGALGKAQLVMDEQAGLSVLEMKSKARRVKRERGLSCIIIDYLQYVKGSGRSQRHLEVGEITRQLKNMAKEFDIPVIVLAQLSRKVEQRDDKRPMMSDLRESGDIEQDADLIMFLYRDEYYKPDTEQKNTVEVVIGKQRNGPTGIVKLGFIKETNRFFDWDTAKERVAQHA
ncbi:replicative DNA helicase [Hazenella sp. IB182353]|uniref:replicative DNA helicase n=1 Tax=Polycladospora coralii TaxID=2771432 RepID=UPI001747BBC3|nr:replicative DNA helicase [Polycladospora coralii]MBS7531843.1 replicative DNA helicase [Polycladospora coralii]